MTARASWALMLVATTLLATRHLDETLHAAMRSGNTRGNGGSNSKQPKQPKRADARLPPMPGGRLGSRKGAGAHYESPSKSPVRFKRQKNLNPTPTLPAIVVGGERHPVGCSQGAADGAKAANAAMRRTLTGVACVFCFAK